MITNCFVLCFLLSTYWSRTKRQLEADDLLAVNHQVSLFCVVSKPRTLVHFPVRSDETLMKLHVLLVMCPEEKMKIWEPMICCESESLPVFFPFAVYVFVSIGQQWHHGQSAVRILDHTIMWFPLLVEVMEGRLCIMATSVPSERIFSKTEQRHIERRNRIFFECQPSLRTLMFKVQ